MGPAAADPRPAAAWRGVAAVWLTWGLYFCWLWPHAWFSRGGELYAGSRTVWADWAAHTAYAALFAYRDPTDWVGEHPLLAGAPFGYPFAADALSGLLQRAGLDPVDAFVWPSIVTTLLLLALLTLFYRELLGSNRRAWLAVTLFLLAGGLGFTTFVGELSDAWSTAGWSGVQPLLVAPPREYTYLVDDGIHVLNFVTSELLPQRGLLLGMTVALALLLAVRRWQLRSFEGVGAVRITLTGLAAASLVVIHVHSLLALAVACGCLALASWRHWAHWTLFAVAAGVPAGLLFMALHGGGVGDGFVTWLPGWLSAAGQEAQQLSWGAFWWRNLGLFLPLAALGMVACGGWRQPLAWAGVALFVVVNLVQLQPWAWDNTKLLTWAHLLLAVPAVRLLAAVRGRLPGGLALAAVAVVALTASGALDLWQITGPGRPAHRMWSLEDSALATQFRRLSRPEDRVLTGDDHHHWVPSLTGRQILLGYPGWLLSYGLPIDRTVADVRLMYGGGPAAADLLRIHRVRWVVFGPDTVRIPGADEGWFRARGEPRLVNRNYRVYEEGIRD